VSFAIACQNRLLQCARKSSARDRQLVKAKMCDVAAKNDDAAFVRAVFVDTITFGHVRQGVEDGGEGISGFAGLDVGHNFDEHAFVELELGESEFEADGAEEFLDHPREESFMP
jgi:hypothetical protein